MQNWHWLPSTLPFMGGTGLICLYIAEKLESPAIMFRLIDMNHQSSLELVHPSSQVITLARSLDYYWFLGSSVFLFSFFLANLMILFFYFHSIHLSLYTSKPHISPDSNDEWTCSGLLFQPPVRSVTTRGSFHGYASPY